MKYLILLLILLCPVAMAENVTVSCELENVTGWQFEVVCDENIVVFENVTGDGFVGNNGNLCYGTMLNGGVYGNDLCELNFAAVGTGVAVIELQNVLLVNSDGEELTSEGLVAGVMLVDNAPVIEQHEDVVASGFVDVVCNVSDEDGDNVTFWVEPCPESVDTQNYSFRWSEIGEWNISVTVGDGYLFETMEFVIKLYPAYDVNCDGVVDIRDLVIVAKFESDVTGDDVCDIRDLVFVAGHFA